MDSDSKRLSKETKVELKPADLKMGIVTAADIEMNSKIWCNLPEELLMLILVNLFPLNSVKFRVVCKWWNHLLSPEKALLQSISRSVPTRSSPAFLFSCLRPSSLTKHIVEECYLLQSEPTNPMYKLSLEFLEREKGKYNVYVATVCKSLLCCSMEIAYKRALFCICNPFTRTWIAVPPPIVLHSWSFIGFTFNTSTKVCILVIGLNQGANYMVMEIYDSGTNEWVKLEMSKTPLSICPTREGVYSRGKFYWINESSVDGITLRPRLDVVAFNVAERSWDVIRRPEAQIQERPNIEYFPDWELTGCDGNVVLVNNKELSLWKLIEDEDEGKIKCRWSEFQPFPRSLCEEALYGQNINNGSRSGFRRYNYPQVVVNSCRWISVYLPGNKLVFFDAEGRMRHKIEGRLLTVFEQSYLISLHGYELNNIWWPS